MDEKIPNMKALRYSSAVAFDEGLRMMASQGYRLRDFRVAATSEPGSIDVLYIVAVFEEVPGE